MAKPILEMEFVFSGETKNMLVYSLKTSGVNFFPKKIYIEKDEKKSKEIIMTITKKGE